MLTTTHGAGCTVWSEEQYYRRDDEAEAVRKDEHDRYVDDRELGSLQVVELPIVRDGDSTKHNQREGQRLKELEIQTQNTQNIWDYSSHSYMYIDGTRI